MNSVCVFSEKRVPRPRDLRGFTLVELMVAVGLSTLLTGALLAALTSSRQLCTSIAADQDLQQTSNVIMNKIIKGSKETNGTFRLSEARSYTIATLTELHFTGTDGIERRYFLSDGGTKLWYRHPVAGVTKDELLYKTPKGTTLTLRFSMNSTVTVEIDVALSRTVNGRAVVGSATTVINIRNHTAL